MLTDVQKNPDKFGQYMNDPRMMKVLSVALGVNVMSGEEAAKGGFTGGAEDTAAAPAPSLTALLSPPGSRARARARAHRSQGGG